MCERIARIVSEGLKNCEDLDTFLVVKPVVLAFEQTLQVSMIQVVEDQGSRLSILWSQGIRLRRQRSHKVVDDTVRAILESLAKKIQCGIRSGKLLSVISGDHFRNAENYILCLDCV
jgi:hypothetical protein